MSTVWSTERHLLLSVGSATVAFLAWVVMGWSRQSSDSVTVALIGLQALTCALAGASAGTYLKRTSTGASRRSVLAWLVLLGSSAWLVFLPVLVTFLQTVADD
jgi:hypothetical protein